MVVIAARATTVPHVNGESVSQAQVQAKASAQVHDLGVTLTCTTFGLDFYSSHFKLSFPLV